MSCISCGKFSKFPHKIFSKFFNISFGIIPSSNDSSTITTGVLVIGSFTRFPVSIIAFVAICFSFIFKFISQYIFFVLNFVFIILIDIFIIINAIIAPNIITFNAYSPVNNPFFIFIFSGLKKYIKFNATPPNTNDVK